MKTALKSIASVAFVFAAADIFGVLGWVGSCAALWFIYWKEARNV